MWVLQACQRLRFPQKLVCILLPEARVQDFEGSMLLEIDMLAQIHFREASSP